MPATGKLLIVVAHPDDEYVVAGSTYRLTHEAGWTADQVIITDGVAGHRYSALAESFYGVRLANDAEGRDRLAAIRRDEVRQAGRVLGIGAHYFLEQRDLGFETNAAAAKSDNWDKPGVVSAFRELLRRNRYDTVFLLLPTAETHGHHRAAALLFLEAIATLPEAERPLTLGVEARAKSDQQLVFPGVEGEPPTRPTSPGPAITFDRCAPFGFQSALSYQIVVNWVIAAHKSQGMFQNDYGRHAFEQFWVFGASGRRAIERLSGLKRVLETSAQAAAA